MHRLEYFILRFLYQIFSLVSFSLAEKISYGLYFLLAHVIKYRRRIILNNLSLVYGKSLPKDPKKLLSEIYLNFTHLWVEFLQTEKLDAGVITRQVTFHNLECVDKAIQKGKGIVMVSGHIGNFEWVSLVLAQRGYPFAGVAKKQSNPYVDGFIVSIRERFGSKIIYTKNALKEGLRFLKQNGILGLISDQDARNAGIFVNFLGQPSSTVTGPAIFHLRTLAPIIFTVAIRRKYAHFDIYFEEINIDENFVYCDESIQLITQKFSDTLEKWVRQYPEQWFWMHKRWKTQPRQALN